MGSLAGHIRTGLQTRLIYDRRSESFVDEVGETLQSCMHVHGRCTHLFMPWLMTASVTSSSRSSQCTEDNNYQSLAHKRGEINGADSRKTCSSEEYFPPWPDGVNHCSLYLRDRQRCSTSLCPSSSVLPHQQTRVITDNDDDALSLFLRPSSPLLMCYRETDQTD